MYEMVIYGVSFDLVGKQPIVLLKTADGNKFLPIWIGHPEAAAILMKLQGAATPRPLTHDLFSDTLGQLAAQVTRVCVTELRDNTFFATITIQQDGDEIRSTRGLTRSRSPSAEGPRFRRRSGPGGVSDRVRRGRGERRGDRRRVPQFSTRSRLRSSPPSSPRSRSARTTGRQADEVEADEERTSRLARRARRPTARAVEPGRRQVIAGPPSAVSVCSLRRCPP
jgi:hypothetical protein